MQYVYPNIKNLNSPLQHGFMEYRLTKLNSAELTQYPSECLDKRSQLVVVYTDIEVSNSLVL